MSGQGAQIPNGPVLLVAEQRDGDLSPLTGEMVSCGLELARRLERPLKVVALGAGAGEAARSSARQWGLAAAAVSTPGLQGFHGEIWCLLIEKLARDWEAPAVLAGHTPGGLDWAPALAVRLGAAVVSAVEGLAESESGLACRRAGLGGKVIEEVLPLAWPLVLTVQPGAFRPPEGAAEAAGEVGELVQEAPVCRSKVLGEERGAAGDADLGRAQVIVAAGRGLGKPENLELVRRLAERFSRSAVAGSRPVCDQGWLGFERQVGQTGATVAPRLYIACGISGARQHTQAIQGAEFIVAVNSDPRAAIFHTADVCVVEDLTAFIPAFLEEND